MSKSTKKAIPQPTTIVHAEIEGENVQFTFLGTPTKEHIEKTVQQTRAIQKQARDNPYKGNLLEPKKNEFIKY